MPPPVARGMAGEPTQPGRAATARHPLVALAVSWPALWLLAGGLEVVAGGVAAWLAGRHGPAVVAVLVNMAVALRFAVTLAPGSIPLISRYARIDAGGALPARAECYTRRLTIAWTGLLTGFALAHGLAAWDWWTTGTIASAQAATCVAVFLGEHIPRAWLLPELGRAGPLRTLRAIWLHARGDAPGETTWDTTKEAPMTAPSRPARSRIDADAAAPPPAHTAPRAATPCHAAARHAA